MPTLSLCVALRRAFALLALAGLLACNQELPALGGGPPPGPATDSAELFSLKQLPRFYLTLDDEALASLEAEPKEWVRGRFLYDDLLYENVGIRLKGNHSFRTLDEKPSFKIKFNEFVPGRRFLGLEGLTLNNMVVDGSMMREWISYRVFRELGVPAPRAGYAQVWLNDEEYGLYLDLEPYDDPFLERVYDDPKGNLYESDRSSDIDRDVDAWDQDEGSDHSRDDLRALQELAIQENNEVFYDPSGGVNLPRFLGFIAGETIVGHFDGHIAGHNFFIYHEPAADQWSYQPWGLDQTLARHVTPYEHEGFLGEKCLQDKRCLVDYVLATREALDRIDALDLETEVQLMIELTDSAMRSDLRRPYSVESVEKGRTRSLAYLVERADELEPQLDCLVDGVEPDLDGDGFGPCFQDCNESDPSIHQGAVELCDGIDNDCTGYVDDSPDCECPSVQSEGQTFYLCHNYINWVEARDFCEAQGHTLAYFESAEQSAEVWVAATEINGGRWAIGLSDRSEENEYRWLDETSPDFSLWADGEPSHQLDWFDCIYMQGSGAWYESNCIEDASFICTD